MFFRFLADDFCIRILCEKFINLLSDFTICYMEEPISEIFYRHMNSVLQKYDVSFCAKFLKVFKYN